MLVKTYDFELSETEVTLSEIQMIEKIIKGKTQYVPMLFKPYEARAKAIARRFLRYDESRIEDVLQESMMKTFQNLSKLRDKSRFGNWYLTIVRNQAIDSAKNESHYFKSATDTQEWDINNWVSNYPDDRIMPDEQISRDEILNQIRVELTALDHTYGDVLRMRYIEEKSYQEIASKLGKPLGTVKSLIFRGKAMLRDRIYAEISTA